jgi:hypothetical protein
MTDGDPLGFFTAFRMTIRQTKAALALLRSSSARQAATANDLLKKSRFGGQLNCAGFKFGFCRKSPASLPRRFPAGW